MMAQVEDCVAAIASAVDAVALIVALAPPNGAGCPSPSAGSTSHRRS